MLIQSTGESTEVVSIKDIAEMVVTTTAAMLVEVWNSNNLRTASLTQLERPHMTALTMEEKLSSSSFSCLRYVVVDVVDVAVLVEVVAVMPVPVVVVVVSI